MMDYWHALILTLAVEIPVVTAVLARVRADNRRPVRIFLISLSVLAVNLISHPLAWNAVTSCGINWLVVEALVVVFEATALCCVLQREIAAVIFAGLLANGLTMFLGVVWGGVW